jgi:galactose mutarotase-like enzyme
MSLSAHNEEPASKSVRYDLNITFTLHYNQLSVSLSGKVYVTVPAGHFLHAIWSLKDRTLARETNKITG